MKENEKFILAILYLLRNLKSGRCSSYNIEKLLRNINYQSNQYSDLIEVMQQRGCVINIKDGLEINNSGRDFIDTIDLEEYFNEQEIDKIETIIKFYNKIST